MLDLLTVFTPVGGGHKSAALALTESARAAGLSAEAIDLFDLGPRVFGDAYRQWHLSTTSRAPAFYGSAYYYPSVKGTIGPFTLGYDILKYDLGVSYAFQGIPLFVEGGFLGEHGWATDSSPSGYSEAGPYVGIGVKF